MEEMQDLKQRLQEQRPASWENLPDISLYMDQVLSILENSLSGFSRGERTITALWREIHPTSGSDTLKNLLLSSFRKQSFTELICYKSVYHSSADTSTQNYFITTMSEQ